MTISRDKIRAIRAALDVALAAVAQEQGLSELKAGRGTFDPVSGSFSFKVEGVATGGKSQEAVAYEQLCSFTKDLPPLGTKLSIGGSEYEIVGMRPRGTKVLGRRADGKMFLLGQDAVRAHWLYKQKAAA